MTENYKTHPLTAFGSDGSDAFQRLTEPYHHELLVHAYRFLGSLDDAEDALQETLLRAWRRWETLREPGYLRAWLYKIDTHVCLDMLDHRKARTMTALKSLPANPGDPLPAPINDPIWLEPLPDEYLGHTSSNPEARYEIRESVSLAFLAVLQTLPARQRVALILMDVLGWKAQEVAELLNLSAAAVNSALQRARATLKTRQPEGGFYGRAPAENPQTSALLTRYVQAWENADSLNLVSLLREDVVLTMPPLPAWYQGRLAVKEFFDTHLFGPQASGRFRLAAVRANGCPAFAVYQRDEHGVYRPGGIQVIGLRDEQIAQIDDFLSFDERLFRHFKIPLTG
jgi:RNA polymerase sigma-70 factor, ECF subfamily